jgi:UDP-N-acetylglucosamine transferase subunit ALG13
MPLPFRRLGRLVAAAARTLPEERFLLQDGGFDLVGLDAPPNLTVVGHLAATDYAAALARATGVIGHAGIGTLVDIRRAGLPGIIIARLYAHGEHVDDHQLQIAAYLRDARRLRICRSEAEFPPLLAWLRAQSRQEPGIAINQRLRSAVWGHLDHRDRERPGRPAAASSTDRP